MITTAFVLIYLFDSHSACRVKIDRLPQGRLAESAEVCRGVLQAKGCKIISERLLRQAAGRVRVPPAQGTRDAVHAALCVVRADMRGKVDWEVE